MICVEEGGMEAISWLSIISPASSIRTILGLEMGIVFVNERNCVHQKLTTNEQTKGSFRKIKNPILKSFFVNIFSESFVNKQFYWTNEFTERTYNLKTNKKKENEKRFSCRKYSNFTKQQKNTNNMSL